MSLLFRFFRFFYRFNDYLRRKVNFWAAKNAGLKIGVGTMLVGTQYFGTEPYLVQIGKNCLITNGVSFVTHDGSIQVPLIRAGEKIEDVYAKKSTFARIEIGDNVFIGIGAIILPGSKLLNNSIVAAGSVVKGVFREGAVIGGNPAREICSIDEYYHRSADRVVTLLGTASDRKSKILSSII